MATKLRDLTIAEFFDLICGEVDLMTSHKKSVLIGEKGDAIRELIFEYREIVDPVSIKQYLLMTEELIRARIEVVVFTMCSNLIDLNEPDCAREVLIEYGINTRNMNNQRVTAEVKSRLERAKSTVLKIQNENDADTTTPEKIRKQMDEQTASLMAYFKFQIDTSSMKATEYAHLVARYNREIRDRLAATKNKK